jgi:hypothetical protein
MDLGAKRKRKIESQIRKELEEAIAEPVPDPEDPDLIDQEMEPPQTPKEEGKRKFKPGSTLDDLPFAIRKKFNGPEPSPPKKVKYQEQPQGLQQLPTIAMCYAVNELKGYDEWVRPCEKEQLSTLLGIKVLAARVHAKPRRKLFKTTIRKENVRRLSIMIKESMETNLKDDDGFASSKTSEDWKGVTIFYIAQSDWDEREACFLDTPSGLVPFWATKAELEDIEHIYNCWKQVYTLTMKAGGKELDPKFFDDWHVQNLINLMQRNGPNGLRTE